MRRIGELLKKKQWKWTAAGVLCFVLAAMIFAMGSALGVQAEDLTLGGSSTNFEMSEGAYLIKTADQMNALRNASEDETTGKSFRLANDLVLSVTDTAKGAFAGTFDGNGHVITASSVSALTSSGTDEAVSEGLLFGTVKGTVQNLIVDVSEEVSYTRTSKVSRAVSGSSDISVTQDATAPYSGNDEFSAKSTDATAKNLATEFDGWTTIDNDNIKDINGKKYYRKSGSQTIKNTTTYDLQTPLTDQFGIICGTLESSGKVEKVYVKGSQGVTVTQTAEKVAKQTTQDGARERYFYYEQGTGSADEEVFSPGITSTVTASAVTVTKTGTETVTAGQETSGGTDLKVTLQPEKDSYVAGNDGVVLTYTLTLENQLALTDPVTAETLTVTATDITFQLPETQQTVSWKQSDGTAFTSAELKKTSASSASLTLTGTVTIPLNELTADTTTYTASVTVTPSKRVQTKVINTYKYVESIENITGLEQYGAEDYTGNTESDVEDSKVPSGNHLNVGIIAGTSHGSITQVKQDMTVTGSQSTGNTADLKVGGIVGAAESDSSASDLYLLGTQNYAGESSTLPDGSVLKDGTMPTDNANWTSYEKYISDSATESAFDLAWLVLKETETDTLFTYTLSGTDQKVTVGLKDGKAKTSGTLTYAAAYNARKALTDASESTIYYDTTGALDLGQSGYYRLLNTYATDGYYHYTTEKTALEGADFVYPYEGFSTTNPYGIAAESVERVTEESSLKDVIRITLQNAGSLIGGVNKIYYETSAIPTGNSPSVEISNGSVTLPFDTSSVTYRLTPYINSLIYPTVSTKAFTQSDREALPAPTVTCFDYYDENGQKNAYQPFSAQTAYEVGTDMHITLKNAAEGANEYTIRYLFSAEALGQENDWDTNGLYTGTADIMKNALTYTDSAVIPETMSGKCYLYVEVSRKNFNSAVYRMGEVTVREKTTLQAFLNGKAAGDRPTLEGDLVTITGNLGSTNATLQYRIGSTGTWTDYTNAGISVPKRVDDYCEIEVRIKTALQRFDGTGVTIATQYSQNYEFEFPYGAACANPSITPQTGLGSGGANAAAPIEQTTQIKLFSTTTDAKLLYLISEDAKKTISLERTNAPAGTLPADGIVDGYKYFQAGDRWYRTANTAVQEYSATETKLYLSHTKTADQLMYVCAVALTADYEASAEQQYIYQVQPQQTAGNPRANLETYYMPGGDSVEKAVVPMGSQVNFYSPTPGVTLYYTTDSTVDELTEVVPAEGVTVQGTYGREFEVWVQARSTNDNMHDSEKIRFVYKIASQETVNTPTATPGTTTNSPTTVIPGNKILLSTTTKGASIFYTTDETSPNVIYDEQTAAYQAGNASTKCYDPSAGIEMPSDGSGYFTITAVAVKEGLENSPEARFPYVYPEAVLTPYATVSSGKVALNTKVVLKNLTEGATIYYNAVYDANAKEADVEDPTLSSVVYSEGYAFTIRQRTIVKAMAVKDGIKSAVVTFVYDPLVQLAAPTASIETGSVVSNGTVLQLSAASGASIYYTIDGSDPTDGTNAAVMQGSSVTLHGDAGGQITIKAYAKAEDSSQSEVAMFTYQFSQNTMGGVTASVATGSVVSNGTKIILMSDLTDADIYYTTDGRSPIDYGTKGTTVEVYGTPGASFTVKAVAISDNGAGTVVTLIYKIREKTEKPTASPAGGTLTVATRVSLDSGEAKIYYTTDGTEPTKSSKLYSESILINRTTTLKAIAVSEDGEMSDVASFYYTAAAKAAMPTADVASGEVLEPGSVVKLSTATQGATIYYTTDGSDPSVQNLDSLLVYDKEGIEISRTVTIKAAAYVEELRMSNVSSFSYIVDTIPAVEMKEAEAKKLEEEGLKDTDASNLARNNEAGKLQKASYVLEKQEINVIANANAQTLLGEERKILAQYQVRLKSDKKDLEEKEIALPIPEGYENATLTVASLDSQNRLTTVASRRADGMLYVGAAGGSSYVVVGPADTDGTERHISYILPLEITAGAVLLGGIGYCVNVKWKKRKSRKKTTRTSDEL